MADSTDNGFEGDFDAPRAQALITKLREELKEAKAATAAETEKAQAASKALAKAEAAAKEAVERAGKAERDLMVEKAVRKHDLDDDVIEFLTGETAEEIDAKAEKLARFGAKGKKPAAEEKADKGDDKPGDDDKPEGGKPDGEGDGRPKPNLKPGHGGDAPEPVDTDAIVAKARSSY